jgi:hypothetical protein
MSRKIEEILGDARGELQERETRLVAMASQVKAELDEVRRALRKLGAPTRPKPSTPAEPAVDPHHFEAQLLGALDKSDEPMTASDLTTACSLGRTPQGTAMKLRHMAREGRVAQVEDGWVLAADAPQSPAAE